MRLLDIAEVARHSGLPPSALRFYESKGLIQSVDRQGLRRRFAPAVLERLGLIALGRAAGFSLAQIGALLLEGAPAQIDRERLRDQAELLDQAIRRLSAARDGLRRAAACPQPSHAACPHFRRWTERAAMSDRLKSRERPWTGVP